MEPKQYPNIVEIFFESKKNANCILELEKDMLSKDEQCILQNIGNVEILFTQIFEKDMLLPCTDSSSCHDKFKTWLLDRYNSFVSHLVSYLIHENEAISEKSLCVLLKFVALEGKRPLKAVTKGTWFFPKELLKKILSEIVSPDIDNKALISKFHEFIDKDDVKLYTLQILLHFLDQPEVTDIFLMNFFTVLTFVKYPKTFESNETDSESSNTLLSQEGLNNPFRLKEKLFTKLFSNVWLRFLKHSFPMPLLKKVLSTAHQLFVPHLQNPCLVTDFFSDSYAYGGVISLLALNGLFLLMQKYNVEYPDFFTKLYSLFDESIVNGKYSARFFSLSELFLSSTHLPAYLVAAFAKKLSRISLQSKTECQLKIIPLICGLLIRHPTLQTLVHRTKPSEIAVDPFIFEAKDPADANALESSLWEIKTLQSHINPTVSRKAKAINGEISLNQAIVSDFDLSIAELYKKERKRKSEIAPAAVHKPSKSIKLTDFTIIL